MPPDLYFRLRECKEMINRIRELVEGDLPILATDQDRILLTEGYHYYEARKKPEPQLETEQPETENDQ